MGISNDIDMNNDDIPSICIEKTVNRCLCVMIVKFHHNLHPPAPYLHFSLDFDAKNSVFSSPRVPHLQFA